MEKENRVLQVITMLSDGNDWKVRTMAKELKTSTRTIYRAMKDVSKCGYVINYDRGHPKIVKYNPAHQELGRMLNFTIEEQAMLRQLVLGTDADNPLRQSLLTKLQLVLDNTGILPKLTSAKGAEDKVRNINQAMKERRQAVLIQYESGNSNTVEDRVVEPVAWAANFHELHAYALDRKAMRTFKLSRMNGVRLLDQPWQYKSEHKVPNVDCFWMTGEKYETVELEMTLLALNLLHEEFPLSQDFRARKSKDPVLSYRVKMPICNPKGAGRFVMGMGNQCRVINGKGLQTWIEENR